VVHVLLGRYLYMYRSEEEVSSPPLAQGQYTKYTTIA